MAINTQCGTASLAEIIGTALAGAPKAFWGT
jgi:hypothetical protein